MKLRHWALIGFAFWLCALALALWQIPKTRTASVEQFEVTR